MQYVLTLDQYNKALALGLVALKVLTKEDAAHLEAGGAFRTEKAVNGLILSFGDTAAAPAPATKGAKASSTKTAGAPAGDEGPLAQNVKAALLTAMERPPGLNTISTWSAAQRKEAIKWTKDKSKPRPDFIKERAARGSKGSSAAPPPVTNGASKPDAGASTGTVNSFDAIPD